MPAPQQPPESIIFDKFSGMKNTVSRERLTQDELERAINVDIDNAGEVHRRRGYTRKQVGEWHSLWGDEKMLGVKNGMLGRILEDLSFVPLMQVGSDKLVYTAVNEEIYFTGAISAGVISASDVIRPWGKTGGQGLWQSPVIHPTATLGPVAGRLYNDPPRATDITSYSGRIYLAAGKTMWATEMFMYDYVDKTQNFVQFEEPITLLMAVDGGIFVGTTGGLHFLSGTLSKLKFSELDDRGILPGSGQYLPAELIHPKAGNGNVPTGEAVVMLSNGGVMAGFGDGTVFNLTQDKFLFPDGQSAASLFRQDQGANAYVVAVDSAGGPSTGCRIGDYVDATIVRGSGF